MRIDRYKKLGAAAMAVTTSFTLLLSGCSESEDSSNSSQSSTTTTTTTTTTTAATTPVQPEVIVKNYDMGAAITYLDCISGYTNYTASPIGEGMILIIDYVYDIEAGKILSCGVEITDVTTDEIVAKISIDGGREFVCINEKGILLNNTELGVWEYYDRGLKLIDQFEIKDTGNVVASKDGKTLYSAIENGICVIDAINGEMSVVEFADGFKVEECYCDGLSPDEKNLYMTLSYYSGEGYYQSVRAAADVSSGKLTMFRSDIDIMYTGYDTDMYMLNSSIESDSMPMAIMTSGDGKMANLGVYTLEGGNFPYYVEQSDILYQFEFDYQDDISPAKTDIKLTAMQDDGEYKTCKVSIGADVYITDSLKYMREENLVVFMCEPYAEEGDYSDNGESDAATSRIGVIDLRYLNFDEPYELTWQKDTTYTIAETELDAYNDYMRVPEVNEYLTDLRAKADRLEEEYGITIFMSNECENMASGRIGQSFMTTDEYFDTLDEVDKIATALADLENALQKYPKGMFMQFKNSFGSYGLRIILAGYIKDDFSAAYAIYNSPGWYDIVFDVSYSVAINFPHELWHSMQSFIENHNSDLLSEEEWAKLNPDGFEYCSADGDPNAYLEEPMDYTYMYEDEDWYFYDNYSKVNSNEDRARIMEVLMSPEQFASDYFAQSTNIQNKLAFISVAIRGSFDTTGWGIPKWEEYLTRYAKE